MMSKAQRRVVFVVSMSFVYPLVASAAPFSDAPGVEVVRIGFKEVAGSCRHGVDGVSAGRPLKKVSEHDRDVLVWRLLNECREPQAVFICARSNTPLVNCTGDPGAATIGAPFRLEGATESNKKVRAYVVCTVDWRKGYGGYEFELKTGPWGSVLTCPGVTEAHEISIEVVP